MSTADPSPVVSVSSTLASVSLSSSSSSSTAVCSSVRSFSYPITSRSSHVDVYHGVSVPDPYNWLEDPDSPETKVWVDNQNTLTQCFLGVNPNRTRLQNKLEAIFNYERYSVPFKRGNRYFFFKNDGLQNQSVLYKQESLESKESVLLDPNTISEDGTASLGTYDFDESGKLLAYGVSRSGSDWQTIHVLRTSDCSSLSDTLQWVKFSSISWTHDDAGFFYSRYPTPKEFEKQGDKDFKRGTETDALSNHALYYHRLGTNQSEDILVYRTPEHPMWMISGEVSYDGLTLLITIHDSCDPVNRLFYFKLNADKSYAAANSANDKVVKLIDNFDSGYSYITNTKDRFFFKTNKDAKKYKVITIDLKVATEAITASTSSSSSASFSSESSDGSIVAQSLIPESSDVLTSISAVNENYLVAIYLHDVQEQLRLFDLESGKQIEFDFKLPDIGSVSGLSCRRQDTVLFYQFTSFLYPGTVMIVDLSSRSVRVFRETKIQNFDPTQFGTEQIFYQSKDGTKVPMFIIKKKNLALDGSNPTLLYGYGGFNISLTPSFSVSRLVFLDQFCGVYAIPNIRGGGEYGEEWHKAGTKLKKQNVFDDFIAAAEYLIQHRYTSASKLTINGASNGGLLVGASINQRPDLFGAAVAGVGVMDMLKFHKFTIGSFWSSDYGNSDSKEEFEYLYKYSPAHTVNNTRPYPAVLLTTGDHDDRVVPLHSYKYISQLQYHVGGLKEQKQPLLIRIECKAGHGAGTPLRKRIEETADVFTFIAQALNIQLKW